MTEGQQRLVQIGVAKAHELGRFPTSREIPTGTIYRHFSSMTALLVEIGIAYRDLHGHMPGEGPQESKISPLAAPKADETLQPGPTPHPEPESAQTASTGPSGPILETPPIQENSESVPYLKQGPEYEEPPPCPAKPEGCNRELTVVFPDIHYPFHDQEAVAIACETVEHYRPWRLLQIGDGIDCAQFASHDARTLCQFDGFDFVDHEITPYRALMYRMLESVELWVQLFGNHEHRVERECIRRGVPGRAAWPFMNLVNILHAGIPRDRIEFVPYQPGTKDVSTGYALAPDLVATHGWSYAKNAAQVHLDLAKTISVHFGHTHRFQVASTVDPFSGRLIKAWSSGTLSQLRPLYATNGQPTSWVHGFTLIYQSDKDPLDWTEYPVQIKNGRAILPDGRKISVR